MAMEKGAYLIHYFISDIHGCYQEYTRLLENIGFSDEDELYVLGDAMDRGPEPIKVILDMMERPNVIYILGNHDEMMLTVLRKFAVELTEETAENLTQEDFMAFYDWMLNGGQVTLQQYRKLNRDRQADILDYLEAAPAYEMLEHDRKLYLLVHAGIRGFDAEKELDEYAPADFLWERADYGQKYFPGDRIFLVTGHTPTPLIREDKQPLIFESNHHIAIDCGCVFGGRLAAYCVETGQTVYVDSEKKK